MFTKDFKGLPRSMSTTLESSGHNGLSQPNGWCFTLYFFSVHLGFIKIYIYISQTFTRLPATHPPPALLTVDVRAHRGLSKALVKAEDLPGPHWSFSWGVWVPCPLRSQRPHSSGSLDLELSFIATQTLRMTKLWKHEKWTQRGGKVLGIIKKRKGKGCGVVNVIDWWLEGLGYEERWSHYLLSKLGLLWGWGLSWWLRYLGLIPGLGRSPGLGNLPTSVFLPGEFHGQRRMMGQMPWDCKDITAENCTGTIGMSRCSVVAIVPGH